jgi:sugar phosphate permease
VLAPSLRSRYHLTLTEVGVLLAAPIVGSIPSLYPWGIAADRFGERTVVATGLGVAAGCLAGSAFASSFAALAVLLFLAGAFGASVSSTTGRAVMHWFEARERGLALGVRQTAVPIAGFWVALTLPALVSGDDPRSALLAVAAVCLAGALGGLLVLRGGDRVHDPVARPAPVRDRAIWVLSGGSALILAPQVCVVGFLVVFLHGERGLSTAEAGAVLAAINALGIGSRIGAGHWSDLAGSRLGPLRLIALAMTGLVAATAVALDAPLWLLLPLLVVTGCVAISWNGLAFAAVAEAAGPARSGAALGLQQSMLAVSGGTLPVLFGALVAATSWRLGIALTALLALSGWATLRRLSG